jgi:hypothetical protein
VFKPRNGLDAMSFDMAMMCVFAAIACLMTFCIVFNKDKNWLVDDINNLGALTKGLDLTAAGVKFDPVKEDRRWRSPF